MGKMAATLKLAGGPLCARKKNVANTFFASLVSILQNIPILLTLARKKCDPSYQNRAVVGIMHFKILHHLYGEKQRK